MLSVADIVGKPHKFPHLDKSKSHPMFGEYFYALRMVRTGEIMAGKRIMLLQGLGLRGEDVRGVRGKPCLGPKPLLVSISVA
jgi:hypothetical protein